MPGLAANTTYYVRAYATKTAGTVYGVEVNYTASERYAQDSSGGGFLTTMSPY